MPPPIKETLSDPVEAAFARTNVLIIPKLADKASLKLPTAAPTLKPSRRDDPRRPPVRHVTEDSDSHNDASQTLPPTETPTLYRLSPNADPTIVTLKKPVTAVLDICETLKAPEPKDTQSLTHPASCPTVKVALPLLETLEPALHFTPVSDIHSLPSQPLRPTRPDPVTSKTPSIAPYSVNIRAPVDPAILLRSKTLILIPSYDIPWDIHPDLDPAVSEASLLRR
jgi:hypothetical protein